ncbi:hypothetical protein [Nocardia brasiliensis]|uniref:hypothetical protein n=1 Tax=Nocardia brasiliensis TaxID=37326 RepID=UPI0018937715|nr:hypothetical protein [Nocardia brasiliensis]MBF6127781.1 hypothetical protein [Nocardia brasiliensis]
MSTTLLLGPGATATEQVTGNTATTTAYIPGAEQPITSTRTVSVDNDGNRVITVNDHPVVFDESGNYIPPKAVIDELPFVSFDQPGVTPDGRRVDGVADLPGSSDGNPMWLLTAIDPPDGAPGEWYVAWQKDPSSPNADADGYVTGALIVKDGNGYHQVTDPPNESGEISDAWLAGLAAVPGMGPGGKGSGGGRSGRNQPSEGGKLGGGGKPSSSDQVGAAREQRVAELTNGTIPSGDPGKPGLKVTQPNVGATDVDVIGAGGQYIAVGGPAKANNLPRLGQKLSILKWGAEQEGRTAQAYFESGTPQDAIDLAKRVLGDDNVKIFTR